MATKYRVNFQMAQVRHVYLVTYYAPYFIQNVFLRLTYYIYEHYLTYTSADNTGDHTEQVSKCTA